MHGAAIDVSALVDRVSASIDGVTYELRHPGELSILQRIEAVRWSEAIIEESPSASACLAHLCQRVLLAPPSVHRRLTDTDRAAISMAFFQSGVDEAPDKDTPTGDDAPSHPKDKRGDWSEHVPRLMRFYGGDALHWLSEVPTVVIEAYTRMLPRLQAEESLIETERMAVGAGNRTEEYTRKVQRRWVAGAGISRRDSRPARKASLEDLASMGISVVIEPAKEVPDAATH